MRSFLHIEVKESRDAFSLLPMELGLIISDLDLFNIASGHVCVDAMLVSRDRWKK